MQVADFTGEVLGTGYDLDAGLFGMEANAFTMPASELRLVICFNVVILLALTALRNTALPRTCSRLMKPSTNSMRCRQ